MDEILSNAEKNCHEAININLSEKQFALSKFQKLADLITYDQNFQSNCEIFCKMVNNQLLNSYELIEEKIKSLARLESEPIDFNKDNIDENTEKEEEAIDIEKELKTFTTDFNEIKKISAKDSELQAMINTLPEYQKSVNKEFIKQENDKIKRASKLSKMKKIRATDFLYEMQEFCAGLMDIDKKNS